MINTLKDIKNIVLPIFPKIVIYIFLMAYIYIFYKYSLQRGYIYGAIIAFLPIILIAAFILIKKPLWTFLLLFAVNYIVMGVNRYISFPASVLMDSILFFCLITVIIKSTYVPISWKRCINPIFITLSIWLIFCILELTNRSSVNDWYIKVRGLAIYPLIMVILVSILINKYKHLKWLLVTWAILTILAALKGYWQKNHGFDSTEIMWLYVSGGAKTHLINSGIRYFSFFSDAGNYGSSMGLSLVAFSISAFYIKNRYLQILFILAALSGGYGMLISGTRGALIVPFLGYATLIFLSKNIKTSIFTLFALTSIFCFLNFTTLGDNNRLIKRMRTAFDTNDASLNVRLENQKKLKTYLDDLPFGAGIGFSSTSEDIQSPYYNFSKIPSDSWFVRVWIQTGIVGLVTYITLILTTLILGGYNIIFKIKNKEIRGVSAAFLAGVVGMTAAAYGNELLGQFPNCYLYFFCFAAVFMGKYYDKELDEHE